MAYSNEELDIEKAYLEKTLDMIHEQIGESSQKAENNRENIVKAQKSMWEDRITESDPTKEIDGAVMAWQHQSYMMMEASSMKFYKKQKSKLELMKETPYFARIDFVEDGEEKESLYIGMGKVSGNDFATIQVYDWRSPICSIFYNYDIGRAKYDCPAGIIEGDLTLKRQYKIAKGQMQYMFDSGLKIDDEVLQDILGQSTDDKMKTIVTSIQREQNDLIRDEENDVLMIQGAAGSGKTSIALHRIAYILYRQQDTIQANNMVIFSPNQIFNDYISDVLPQLGEENVNLTTFNDYLEMMLDSHHKMEDWNSQMEYILSSGSNHGAFRKKCIEVKTSEAFVDMLKAYVVYLKDKGFGFRDIAYDGEKVISKQQIIKLYHNNLELLSPKQSLNRIKLRLNRMLDPLIEKKKQSLVDEYEAKGKVFFDDEKRIQLERDVAQAFSEIRHQIDVMTNFNVIKVYQRMYSNRQIRTSLTEDNAELPVITQDIANYTVRRLDSGYLFYEDALAIAYLKGALEGVPNQHTIKHVVIDEAQDYSFLHYEIFAQLFGRARFTLLGDLNQSINPYLNIGKYERINAIFDKKASRVTLKRSYRSTKEIASFCSDILLHEDKTIYLDRHGKTPVVEQLVSNDAYIDVLATKVKQYMEEGYGSIAIICKTEKESKKMFKQLEGLLPVHMISRMDIHYKKGVVVVPSYLAKGLEFDVVLVDCHGVNNYVYEEERNLFYTVCSRALHVLEVLYTEKKPLFLRSND